MPVHLVRSNARRSACGTLLSTRQLNWADAENGILDIGVQATLDWHLVTCKRCPTTLQYRLAKEIDPEMGKHEEPTVGIPTQGSEDTMLERPINMGKVMTEAAKIGRPTAEPLAGALLGHNESFGPDEPTIHAMARRGNPSALCMVKDLDDRPTTGFSGYSTMDGGAVNCRACLQHPEFIRRNNMFTEMMSPTLPDGPREPIAKVHDREREDDYGTPNYLHDCEACVFLGGVDDYDLYWCGQGGIRSTVIGRFSSNGPDYISGLDYARDNEKLALAVVRAFKMGLLSDEDMSWL